MWCRKHSVRWLGVGGKSLSCKKLSSLWLGVDTKSLLYKKLSSLWLGIGIKKQVVLPKNSHIWLENVEFVGAW